jgi:glycine cleavage system H protein
MDPKNLRYATTHEWASLDGGQCTVGITKFAVEQLTDIVYIELPDVGDNVFAGESFGEIESVKAVTTDPYGQGWMVKIKVEPGTTLDHLMTLEQYEKQIASEGH